MNMRNDVFDRIKTTKRRISEAEKILAYLEKNEAPKTQITAMKRIVKHLDNQYSVEKLAFALADLQTTGSVRPEDEEENAFTL
ncbi:hypothetical protein ACH0BF_24815 [Pseudobacillus sp. 179-B 2D1 NHS]|uniref:hypothetical protein n=1 Tax=Pseudobacillus sp. 179-B 2D1 NHS TaxID=3374292 RepID=UPI00387A4296